MLYGVGNKSTGPLRGQFHASFSERGGVPAGPFRGLKPPNSFRLKTGLRPPQELTTLSARPGATRPGGEAFRRLS